jgi:hypothetical protein
MIDHDRPWPDKRINRGSYAVRTAAGASRPQDHFGVEGWWKEAFKIGRQMGLFPSTKSSKTLISLVP